MVPKVSLLSLLLEDEADDWTHQELVDHRTHHKKQVDTKNTIPPQSMVEGGSSQFVYYSGVFPKQNSTHDGGRYLSGAYGHIKAFSISPLPHQRQIYT